MKPLIFADIPDPDVIRVGDVYYMTSTTMYFTPGCPIMKSSDLINWELVGYVYDILEENDHMNLQNGKHDYGRGSWASCLRYESGVYYVFFAAYNTGKTYIFHTEDIENGIWRKYTLDGIYHDMSVLFDDGRVFMVYGAGAIKVIELTEDATAIKHSGLSKTIIQNADPTGGAGLAEGSHIYKLNGFYYIFIIAWPKNMRRIQVCYRSDKIDGEYECKTVLDDDMGFQNAGVAQGGIVDTPEGKWFALLFQDHGAVGRVPVLVSVTWENDWPIFGENGKVSELSHIKQTSEFSNIIQCDDFKSLAWQWNHNPIKTHFSIDKENDKLRLTTAHLAKSLTDARNTLTQRTFGPSCSAFVTIDVGGMKNGDFAGLSALQDRYAFVGVKSENDVKTVIFAKAGAETKVYTTDIPEIISESVPLGQNTVFLSIDFNFTDAVDEAKFYYSLDNKTWQRIGETLKMTYKLTHFTGYRIALFNFATKDLGGYVDFSDFLVF